MDRVLRWKGVGSNADSFDAGEVGESGGEREDAGEGVEGPRREARRDMLGEARRRKARQVEDGEIKSSVFLDP